MSNYIKSSNPFEDDDDDGDFEFVNRTGSSRKNNTHTSHSSGSGWNPSREESNPFDDRRQHIQRQIDVSENTQLDSTQRALASIYDSESMGAAIGEELIRQGETLDSIENKTGNMQTTLKTSQRHINNIKSVFGGIKNWWNRDKGTSQTQADSSSTRDRLRETIDKNEKVERPKADFSGFYEDNDQDLDQRFMANAPKSATSRGGYSMISPVTRSAREEEIDENLSLMCEGMGRLKGLARDLGGEIDRQNEQLDRINGMVEVTDDLVKNQNTQMRRILKK